MMTSNRSCADGRTKKNEGINLNSLIAL